VDAPEEAKLGDFTPLETVSDLRLSNSCTLYLSTLKLREKTVGKPMAKPGPMLCSLRAWAMASDRFQFESHLCQF
jgi:hypothetical protein